MHVVICLEGCHGAGKTSIIQDFKNLGFVETMDEGFMNVPPTLLHPQSLLMESAWVCSWFQRLMNHVIDVRKSGNTAPTVIVTDRSPLSAVFYCRNNGALLEPLIRHYVRELSETAGIHVLTVHMRTPRDLLWTRIQERLRSEPHRIALNEDSEKWMDDSLAFYDGMSWDATIENGHSPLVRVRDTILSTLGESCPPLREALAACMQQQQRWQAPTAQSPSVPRKQPQQPASKSATPVKDYSSDEHMLLEEFGDCATIDAAADPAVPSPAMASPASQLTRSSTSGSSSSSNSRAGGGECASLELTGFASSSGSSLSAGAGCCPDSSSRSCGSPSPVPVGIPGLRLQSESSMATPLKAVGSIPSQAVSGRCSMATVTSSAGCCTDPKAPAYPSASLLLTPRVTSNSTSGRSPAVVTPLHSASTAATSPAAVMANVVGFT